MPYLVGLPSYKNLREGLKDLLARKQACLPEVEEDASDGIPHHARGSLEALSSSEVGVKEKQEQHFRKMSPHLRASPRGSAAPTVAERRSQVSRENRYARYEAVWALHQQAFSEREIARRLHMARHTVHQFVTAEAFPERSRRPYRGSLLDPYKPYLLKRWQEGCWNGAQLSAEIKERGYTGADSPLRRFIADLRKKHQAVGTATALSLESSQMMVKVPDEFPPPPRYTRRMSATRASWLCVSQPDKLDEEQRCHVAQLQAAHPDLATAYLLSQSFVAMLAQRRETDLDAWLTQAEQSGIAELSSFAQGIRDDYTAVRAAFSSPWSNGQVEAQVNCLKLQKRLMFGRANFDLLRLRVLRRA